MTEIACEEWLALLKKHEAKLIVIGGFAGVLHGPGRPTIDLDVVPDWTASNLTRLIVALEAVGAHSRTGPPTNSDEITVASLDDIITSKEFANRREDSEALPELRRMRDANR